MAVDGGGGAVILVLLVIGSLMVALLRIHQHRELLHHQNQTDALTGLFNRLQRGSHPETIGVIRPSG